MPADSANNEGEAASRRTFLTGAGAAALAGLTVAACRSDDESAPPGPTTNSPTSVRATVAVVRQEQIFGRNKDTGPHLVKRARAWFRVQSRLDGEPLEDYIKPVGGGFFFVLPGPGDGWLGEYLLA